MSIRILATALCFAAVLFADGGAVAFRKQAGSLLITVFSASGGADLSVLVQDTRNTRVVMDAEVTMTLTKPGGKQIALPATHAQATNKLLYAARPVVTEPGEWNLNVQIKSQNTAASVDGVIAVPPQQGSVMNYWLYIAFAPAGIPLFLLNQHLKVAQTSVCRSSF